MTARNMYVVPYNVLIIFAFWSLYLDFVPVKLGNILCIEKFPWFIIICLHVE